MHKSYLDKKIHFLIIPQNGGVLGLCREFGFIEEGASVEEVEKKLFNGAMALLEAVRKNPSLQPSLAAGLPLKYLFLYYVSLLKIVFSDITGMTGELFIRPTVSLMPNHA